MLDFELADMYSVETRTLNQAVKRNTKRFPADFMFQLSYEEWNNLKSQFVTSSWGGTRKLPFAFTEQGVAMLSGLLNSEVAIEVNINIMRAFVKMRQYLLSNTPKQELEELRKRIDYLEEDVSSDRESYEKQFDELFSAFAKVSAIIQSKTAPLERKRVKGFTAEKGNTESHNKNLKRNED